MVVIKHSKPCKIESALILQSQSFTPTVQYFQQKSNTDFLGGFWSTLTRSPPQQRIGLHPDNMKRTPHLLSKSTFSGKVSSIYMTPAPEQNPLSHSSPVFKATETWTGLAKDCNIQTLAVLSFSRALDIPVGFCIQLCKEFFTRGVPALMPPRTQSQMFLHLHYHRGHVLVISHPEEGLSTF